MTTTTRVCRCTGDLRADGFSADPGVLAPGVPPGWFVHAGCGYPTRAYAQALSAAAAT